LLALKVNILLQMLRCIIHTTEKNIFGLEWVPCKRAHKPLSESLLMCSGLNDCNVDLGIYNSVEYLRVDLWHYVGSRCFNNVYMLLLCIRHHIVWLHNRTGCRK
jgi:hypothetical protein